MYEIERAWVEDQNQIICHKLVDEKYTRMYQSIRTGLSWPQGDAPGYYCVLGQGTDKGAAGVYPLIFMMEDESTNPDILINQLTDDLGTMKDDMDKGDYIYVYADLSQDNEYLKDLFHEYIDDNKIQGICLIKAPFERDFKYGLNLIHRHIRDDRSLEIKPDTILQRQLGKLPKGDLGERPEENFYAVNALRHVVAGFHKHPTTRRTTVEELRALKKKYGPPDSFFTG